MTGSDITRADELFLALDGQVLAHGGDNWELRIAGIHEDRARVWAQLIISGPRQYAATFRADTDEPGELLQAVQGWLTESESGLTVPSLARV